MTIKVNGQDAVAGCVVDGHWGQYGGVHLLHRALEFGRGEGDEFERKLREILKEWPRNSDETQAGSYGADTDEITGPFAAIMTCGASTGQTVMELSEEVFDLLNEHTEGGRWEWWEGECFLRETDEDGYMLCPECGKPMDEDSVDDPKVCDC